MAIAADAFFASRLRALGCSGTSSRPIRRRRLALDPRGGAATGPSAVVESAPSAVSRAAPDKRSTCSCPSVRTLPLDRSSVAVEASSRRASTACASKRLCSRSFLIYDLHGLMEEYYQAKRRLFIRPSRHRRRSTSVVAQRRRLRLNGRVVAGAARHVRAGPTRRRSSEGLKVGAAGSRFCRARGRFNVEMVPRRDRGGRPARRRWSRSRRCARRGCAGRFEAARHEGQPVRSDRRLRARARTCRPRAAGGLRLGDGRLVCVLRGGICQQAAADGCCGRVADHVVVTSTTLGGEEPLAIRTVLQGTGVDVVFDPGPS